jgi:Holliday junction resolvasome RuvABC DNA-binding subunit
LQYHAVNPEALLTKAEALKRMYLKQKEENNPNAQTTYNEMEQTYITLVKLGYREMPYKAYQKWLKTAKLDKEKYQNKKIVYIKTLAKNI